MWLKALQKLILLTHSAAQTLGPEGAVGIVVEDAWEAATLILEGMEH